MHYVTVLDSRMVEFKYDNDKSRYLTTVLLELTDTVTEKTEREWRALRDFTIDKSTINQMNEFLIPENKIYSSAVDFGDALMRDREVLGVRKPLKNETLNFGAETGFIYRDFESEYEIAGVIMKAAMSIEPYDHYAQLEGGMMIDYENSKGNISSKRMMSSDEMEKYLIKLGKTWRIKNVRFTTTYPGSFQLHKMGRFQIRREFFYVVKTEDTYLLYEDDETLYSTSEISRALKFISEDEALDYVFTHMHNNTISFSVERVTKHETLDRCLPEKKDVFKSFSGTLEETLPFPSNHSK